MKQEVLINIKGVQIVDNVKDTTEFFTKGNLYIKNNKTYITYDESAVVGFKDCMTTLKIDGPNKVTLLRSGEKRSHLIMELGRRNTGYYATPYGQFAVSIYANKIKSEFSEKGGKLYCRYNLDVNSSHVSTNEIYVDIKPCEKENHLGGKNDKRN